MGAQRPEDFKKFTRGYTQHAAFEPKKDRSTLTDGAFGKKIRLLGGSKTLNEGKRSAEEEKKSGLGKQAGRQSMPAN